MKRTSTEAHVYMLRHQGAKVEHFDVSNVIYHKFSHGPVSYTLSGENVNVMLELYIFIKENQVQFHNDNLFSVLLVSFLLADR